jgi:hypothetical protein
LDNIFFSFGTKMFRWDTDPVGSLIISRADTVGPSAKKSIKIVHSFIHSFIHSIIWPPTAQSGSVSQDPSPNPKDIFKDPQH